jgi:hypothetical protein
MSEKVQLEVAIGVGSGARPDEVDEATRDLLEELRESGLTARLKRDDGPAPVGSKGVDPVTIGTILMAALPLALPKLVDIFRSWVQRSAKRSLTVRAVVDGRAREYHLDAAGLDSDEVLAAFKQMATATSPKEQAS